jgi:hypothetical protein
VNRILINYRREDSRAHASLLYDWISDRYGADQVFMDVDTIEHGADYIVAIERAVQSADLMLVVIGSKWLVDAEGRSRLDDPEDYVRLEIEAALTNNIRILPILVNGARIPTQGGLPSALAGLNRRQAFFLSDRSSQADLDELGRILDMIMKSDEGRGYGRSSAPSESWFHALVGKLRVGRPR